MKKVLFSAMALALLATSSCKKDDDNGSSQNFTVGSTTYNVVDGGVINGPSVVATSGDLNALSSMTIYFNGMSAPTTSGSYKVVASSPAANEVSFVTSVNNNGAVYTSTGNGTVNATVTVSGGKITVNMPKAWAKKASSTDSVEVSANFTSD